MRKKANKKGIRTIRQRESGLWEGMHYFLGKKKSIYGSDEEQVRKRLNKIYADILSGKHYESTNKFTGDWLITWLNEYAKVKYGTYVTYEGSIAGHFIPAIDHIKLKHLKTDTLSARSTNA